MRDPNDNRPPSPAAAAAAAVRQTAAQVTAQRAAQVQDIPARRVLHVDHGKTTLSAAAQVSAALAQAQATAPSAPAAAQQYTAPSVPGTPSWTFLERLRAQVLKPEFIRAVLAPLVWEMFKHLDSNPSERRARLTLALLTLMERGDDWVAQNFPLTDYRAVVKMALDNPLTDAAQARLSEAAAVVLGEAIERAYSAVKPVFDWLRAALGR